MSVPEQLEEEPVDLWHENTWGVSRNIEPPKRSPAFDGAHKQIARSGIPDAC